LIKSPGMHIDEVCWHNDCSCKKTLYHSKWALHHLKRALDAHKRALYPCKEALLYFKRALCHHKQKSPVSLPEYAYWQGVVTWRAAPWRRVCMSRPRLILLLPSGIRPGAGGTHFWESTPTHVFPYQYLPHSSTWLYVVTCKYTHVSWRTCSSEFALRGNRYTLLKIYLFMNTYLHKCAHALCTCVCVRLRFFGPYKRVYTFFAYISYIYACALLLFIARIHTHIHIWGGGRAVADFCKICTAYCIWSVVSRNEFDHLVLHVSLATFRWK